MPQNYSPDGTKLERTGYRDQRISERHRLWGFNCPAANIDFLMVEYDRGRAVALVEYKERHAIPPDLNTPTIAAFRDIASNRSRPIPFFVVFYWPERFGFVVVPANDVARSLMPAPLRMSERAYVSFLYRLRGTPLDEEMRAILWGYVPPDDDIDFVRIRKWWLGQQVKAERIRRAVQEALPSCA